jgi:hypothetical protein
VKLKTVTFLAAGIPVVSTSVGLEGIAALHGRDALVADEPILIATELRRLLQDPHLSAAIGTAGRALAVEQHGWDSVGANFANAVERLVFGESPLVAGETSGFAVEAAAATGADRTSPPASLRHD